MGHETQCQQCNGEGEVIMDATVDYSDGYVVERMGRCDACDGRGTVECNGCEQCDEVES